VKVTGGLNIEWGQIDPKVTGGLSQIGNDLGCVSVLEPSERSSLEG